MVDRKKQTKIYDTESLEEDRISRLHDFLISDNILSHLSTKDAIRTSVLSTRWRNLWQTVPGLDLDSLQFSNIDAFVDFGDRFFDSNRESWILKLKLSIYGSNDDTNSHLNSWIDYVTKRRIQQLDVCFDSFDRLCEIPMSIYTCETLVQLRLCWLTLGNADFVSLPCLKIMHLECVRYLNEATREKLISGSPVLEDLAIMEFPGSKEKLIHIRSQTVKSIQIGAFNEFVIDAPILHSLKTYIFKRKKFKIIGSGFPAKIDIVVISTVIKKPAVSEILTDISKVRELVINGDMWKGIFLYSKSEKLLQFPYLTRLNARYCQSDLELLPILLESCPNLQSLILERKDASVFMGEREDKEPNVMFSTVPQCLVSSLTYVELKRLIPILADKGEMELVRYFLINSAILEKMKLDDYYTEMQKYEILTMPRCSNACEVLLL